MQYLTRRGNKYVACMNIYEIVSERLATLAVFIAGIISVYNARSMEEALKCIRILISRLYATHISENMIIRLKVEKDKRYICFH